MFAHIDTQRVRVENPEFAAAKLPRVLSTDFQAEPIGEYVARYGVLIESLTQHELEVLIAARYFEQEVGKLSLSAAKMIDPYGKRLPLEIETEQKIEKTSYQSERVASHNPEDEPGYRPIESIEELPRLRTLEWLKEELSPEMFISDLFQGALMVRDHERGTENPVTTSEQEKVRQIVESTGEGLYERIHACVLLDTSGSMRGSKLTVAKGFALAFLRAAYERRGILNFRTFSDSVQPMQHGRGEAEFHSIVRHVLKQGANGGTNLYGALSDVCSFIKKDKACAAADILVITDGEAYLGEKMLGKINLHSCIITDGVGELNNTGQVLRRWSKHLLYFSSAEFSKCLSLREADFLALRNEMEKLAPVLQESCSVDLIHKATIEVKALSKLASSLQAVAEHAKDSEGVSKSRAIRSEIDRKSSLLQSAEQIKERALANMALPLITKGAVAESASKSESPNQTQPNQTQERSKKESDEGGGKKSDQASSSKPVPVEKKLNWFQKIVRAVRDGYKNISGLIQR